MAVRRVPEDYPDVQSAVDASASGDRIEIGPGAFSGTAVVTVDGLTIDDSRSFFSSADLTLGPGVLSLTLPGPTLFGATGNDLNNAIVGGPASGYLYGLGGDDVLVGGPSADWMEGGTGNDTYDVDDTTSPGGQGGGNRIPNLIVGNGGDNLLAGLGGGDEMRGGGGNDTYVVDNRGDRAVEAENQGTDEVFAAVDHELPANVENLFLQGAAVWGSGNGLDNRIVGDDLDNRLVGWGGNDTLTGGAGDDVFYLLAAPYFRTTITDFRPGAGPDEQIAFSRDLFSSPEQAYAASWQVGPDVRVIHDSFRTVVLPNIRLADLAPDDFLIV